MALISSPDFLLLISVFVALYYLRSKQTRKHLPPGPGALPIIGNAHQMPVNTPWIVFSQWYKKFGDLVYLDILGQSIVVINSPKVAKDLLDKRSTIYSDRPVSVMCGQLVGFGPAYAMQNYNDRFRKQRKMVSSAFGVSKVSQYHALQERQAASLLSDLLQNPGSLSSEVHLRISAITLRVIYGYTVKSKTDKMMQESMEMMNIFNKTANPGNFLVDVIPSLRHIPRWMPGSGFLDLAEGWRVTVTNTARETYEWCRDNLDNGKARMPNLVGNMIQESEQSLSSQEKDPDNLIWAAVGTLGGGLDTSASAILSFFMAMVLHPEVQKKAHAELDAVLGNERLPRISDQHNLPYIRSIMVELLRWACIGPLGIPHALSQDDVYEGYHFRKGTIVLANIWHMLHDPEVYEYPMEFRPERFTSDDVGAAKIIDLAFGFGRRLCPGKHFAEGTLFATIATTLTTCHILPAKNDLGEVVLPQYAYTTGTISFPEDFSIEMTPRSIKSSSLLSEAVDQAM